MKFKLEIELGNDAMRDGSYLAVALNMVSDRISHMGLISEDTEDNFDSSGIVMDENGNKVGFWYFI